MDETLDIRKMTDCYYFLNRSCKKGDECPYRHKDSILYTSIVCSYFPDCKKGRDCEFRHPDPNMPQDTKLVCWFFLHQTCKSGDKCKFLHVKPSNTDAFDIKESLKEKEAPKEGSILSRLKPKSNKVEQNSSKHGIEDKSTEIKITSETVKKPKVLPLETSIMSRLKPKNDTLERKERSPPKRKRIDKESMLFDNVKKQFSENEASTATSSAQKSMEMEQNEVYSKNTELEKEHPIHNNFNEAKGKEIVEEKGKETIEEKEPIAIVEKAEENQGVRILEELGFSLDDLEKFPENIKSSVLKATSVDEILEVLNV